MHWILQKNHNRYFERWIEEFKKLNSKYTVVEIVAFSDDLPIVKIDGPCVVYGTTSLMKNAKKQWNPGVFFVPENFQVSTWQKIFGNDLLNHDGYVCKLNDLLTSCPDECFIRPNDDLKDFTGVVVKKENLHQQIYNINKGGFLFDGTINVFVAPPKHIQKEYRFFIVDGKIITGCQYKLKTMGYLSEKLEPEVLEFAQKMCDKWTPDKVCVMDVALDGNDEYKVLEFNCFNASGIYICDLNKIIASVENLVTSYPK